MLTDFHPADTHKYFYILLALCLSFAMALPVFNPCSYDLSQIKPAPKLTFVEVHVVPIRMYNVPSVSSS